MKYAIVENSGKQYKAIEGATIEVDRLQVEHGQQVIIDSVLLLVKGKKISVGTPIVKGARVNTTVLGHYKRPKIVVFKYRPRKNYRVKSGHRQQFTCLQVDSIEME